MFIIKLLKLTLFVNIRKDEPRKYAILDSLLRLIVRFMGNYLLIINLQNQKHHNSNKDHAFSTLK